MTEKTLKGKKVFLRHPKPEDFVEFAAMAKKSRKFHNGLVKPPSNQNDFLEYVNRNEKETDRVFLICLNINDSIIGAINLSQIFRKSFQNAYLGYYVGADHAGKGYMTEAISLILKFAFKELKLHRIEANVQLENKASIAVLKKNGFTKEGFSKKYLKIGGKWRDHERWAIVAEDWKQK